jgi:poly-gamma-glutamate capsule biosynthesis protein CapA/YwtB (metallophosphatase superfamily)
MKKPVISQRKKIIKEITIFISFFLFIIAAGKLVMNSPDVLIEETPTKHSENISIVFAGDINFDRYVRKQALIKGNYNYIFDDVREIFQDANLVVANLEGPITDNKSISMNSEIGSTKNYFFTFPVESAQVLYDENLKLVNIGNNHIYNFGTDGLEQTKKHLTEANVDYFGHVSLDDNYNDETKIIEIDGYKILFVNYNQFLDTDLDKLYSDISIKKNKVDLVVLYTHWGLEYKNVANNVIQELAHKFIDVGVDVIIGSHPHVVQQSEIYKGKQIYYSLGNFIFDQYFETAVKEGLLVEMTIDPNTNDLEFKEYKTVIELDSSVTLLR